MPQIAELREIDGAIWARIPPFSADQGVVQMLSEAEIAERDRKTSKLLDEIERLTAALRIFVGCAYPVATEITPRGYDWRPEKDLDYALSEAKKALGEC